MLWQFMLVGKQLVVLFVERCNDDNEVKGCQSWVWLMLFDDILLMCFMLVWLDSKIICGVLVIIQEKVNMLLFDDLCQFDFYVYFFVIGLDCYLS